MRKGMQSETSCKQEWSEAHRQDFIAKLLRAGWEHRQTRKKFESEVYQRGDYRIETDCAGAFLWQQTRTGWGRVHGLSDGDIDLIKGNVLPFREFVPKAGKWRIKRFDLERAEWL